MNAIQRERNKKLREEVKNDLKVFKLQTEIRKGNEERLRQELGIQKSLTDFHKPVTEKLEQHEVLRKEHFKAIEEGFKNLPQIEAPPPADIFDFDKELDVHFLERNDFPRPSKLFDESKEALQEIIDKVKEKYLTMGRRKGNIMSQIARMAKRDVEREEALLSEAESLREHMFTLEDYRDRLKDLQRKEKYVGRGVEDKLDILAQLTYRICNGAKGKKLHNQVVDLLDALLREGTITNEQVKHYYKNFSINK